MGETEVYEQMLLALLCDNGIDSSNESVGFIQDIKNGKFLNVLQSKKCENIYSCYLENYSSDASVDRLLEKSVSTYLKNECVASVQQLEVLCVGVASLHAFIQSNWTGPPLECEPAKCVFPWLQSWYETSDTGQNLQSHILECLVLDGEACNPVVTHPELLLFAGISIQACSNAPQPLLSSHWWLLRYLFTHQQVLDEFSPKLYNDITVILEKLGKCEQLMIKEYNEVCFHLEASRIYLYYRYVTRSYVHMEKAVKNAKMTVELLGALGLRTKFQVKELPQLTVKVTVSEERSVNNQEIQKDLLPKDLLLNDEVRLDKIKFLNEPDGKFPLLHPVEQAVILGLFHQTLKSRPKDDLTNEELVPYLTCVLSHPLVWSLQTSALLQRSHLEKDQSRSAERAMMQTEELVHCLLREIPDVSTRQQYFFISLLPPKWTVETQYADQMVSLGLIKGALDVYLRLQLWVKAIDCYNILNLRHKASEIIRQELNKKETVKLWCLLGDATDDPECYEKAWELSRHKSGSAQRHWGLYYFNKRKYAECIPHLRESLKLNSLQVSLWFRLGYAALDQEDWSLCALAYHRYCSLDPESFEAWNNLAKAYVKMNQKSRAWKTLQEALKWDFENWKLWDNYMVVSVDVGEFLEVMKSYNRILDLKPKHIDVDVLRILVEAITTKKNDSLHVQSAEKLFTRLTQEVRNHPIVWQLYAKLMRYGCQERDLFDTLVSVATLLQKGFWSSVQDPHFEKDVKKCLSSIEIVSELVNVTFECCEGDSIQQKAVQMLASSKLCLQTLIARIKKCYGHFLSEGSVADQSLISPVQELEVKLEQVVSKLQHRKASTT